MHALECFQSRTVNANYVSKCNDDTFVNSDAAIKEAEKIQGNKMVVGNMNY